MQIKGPECLFRRKVTISFPTILQAALHQYKLTKNFELMMEEQSSSSSKVQPDLLRKHKHLEQDMFQHRFNADSLPRRINQRLAEAMETQLLKKVETRLQRDKNYRNSCPLFILKLHHYLIVKLKHKDTTSLQTMIEQAKQFVLDQIAAFQSPSNPYKDEENHVYKRKLKAFLQLFNYLVQWRLPTQLMLYQIIKNGIYGTVKGKYKSILPKIRRYVKDYQKIGSEEEQMRGQEIQPRKKKEKLSFSVNQHSKDNPGGMKLIEEREDYISENIIDYFENIGLFYQMEAQRVEKKYQYDGRKEKEENFNQRQYRFEDLWKKSEERMLYSYPVFGQSPQAGDIFDLLDQMSCVNNFWDIQ